MNGKRRYAGLSDERLGLAHALCETFERSIRNSGLTIESQLLAAPEDLRDFLFLPPRENLWVDCYGVDVFDLNHRVFGVFTAFDIWGSV